MSSQAGTQPDAAREAPSAILFGSRVRLAALPTVSSATEAYGHSLRLKGRSMSRMRTAQGDDHPEAAGKHLQDASTLLAASRADGAAYLSGYVVECSLKTIYQLETGTPLLGHDFGTLHNRVTAAALVAGAKTAKYLTLAVRGVLASPVASWRPEMRYRASVMAVADARSWVETATLVHQDSVGQMLLDGVL